LYFARTLRELGEFRDAYLEFDGTAEEAAARAATEERFAKTRDTAILERDQLNDKIALVTVTVAHPESAGTLQIGGKEVPKDRWGKPFPAMPGPVEVVLSSSAGAPVTQSLTLTAGEKKDVTLDALTAGGAPPGGGFEAEAEASVPESRRALRPYAYIAGGVGLAGLGLFTVAGLMANGTYSDLSEACNGPCPADRQSDVDAGKTQQTLANVGLIVGAVGLAAGATLFVLSITGGEASDEQQAARPRTQLLVGPAYAGVRGSF
ncbi:MAG TPA: hypothetical protein VLS89_05880, partial [Candidatus Nanopelagicales bacterium]|nr:hypothetical protein [Candidatus Nanopelagicales bacterium]